MMSLSPLLVSSGEDVDDSEASATLQRAEKLELSEYNVLVL